MESLRSVITAEIPHLRRYARVLVGNREMADDLVQNCLERALKNASQWNPEKGLRSWLFRILHNDFVSWLRKRDRENDFQRRFPETGVVPANHENVFELRQVNRAMAKLPSQQLDVLLLIAVSGFSYEEASSVLDVPVGTVRSRLSRARETLRILMAPSNHDQMSDECLR